jgi:thiamine biosynthesis protein ThiI
MKQDLILIRYGEIFLKSESVRKILEKILMSNIKTMLKKKKIKAKIFRERGRIFIKTSQIKDTCKILQKIFGIISLSPCWHLKTSKLKKIQDFCKKNFEKWLLPYQTFAVRAKRIGKHKYTSQQLAKSIGDVIDRKVKLKNPDKEIWVEVREDNTYIYIEKIKGLGGLPVTTSGKVISLISGGIDSPVASWLMMKRGCKVIFIHFHSFPIVSKASVNKTKELLKLLSDYQHTCKVYFLPFGEVQMYIKSVIPPKYRIIIYRRLMLKVAEKIAKKEKAKAIVTGESLAQVSSQTLDNLAVIEEAIKIPVLRPLVGMDKSEIIELAKKIGTYNISIKPQEDCCTLFVPKHSTAKAKLDKIKELEKRIPLRKFIRQILKNSEIEVIK